MVRWAWCWASEAAQEGVLVTWKSAKRAMVEQALAAVFLLQLHDTTKIM